MSDEWIGDVFERLQKDVPEKEWERLEMTLDNKALDEAAEAVNDSGLLTYHWTKAYDVAKIAITAYLAALPIPEGEVGETVKALHRLSGELPPGTRGHDAALRAADLIIRQQQEIAALRGALTEEFRVSADRAQEIERLKHALQEIKRAMIEDGIDPRGVHKIINIALDATESAMTPEPTPQSSPDRS